MTAPTRFNYRTDEEREATEAIIAALAEVGIDADLWHTGGGCMALRVEVSPGYDDRGYADEILITDADASLPDGNGIFVGHYDGDGREEGEMLIEQDAGPYDVAEIVRVVAERVNPSARKPERVRKFVPIMDLRVGDSLPSWSGTIVAIRDTPSRRYITVQPEDGGPERTDYQGNRTQIFAEVVKPRRVGFIFTMEIRDDVTEDQMAFVAGNAYVQFNEPVLSDDDDGEDDPGATKAVVMLPFDPALMDRLTSQSAARGMTIPEYVAALAEIDGE